MARGKRLTVDEQIEKMEQELANLKAKKEAEAVKVQALELVKGCDDAAKLQKVIKIFG